METYTKGKNTEKIMELNAHFHALIRKFAKNNYVCKQIEAIQSTDRHFRKIALSHPDEIEPALKEHKKILDKILANDVDGAEKAIRAHIHFTNVRVKKRTI